MKHAPAVAVRLRSVLFYFQHNRTLLPRRFGYLLTAVVLVAMVAGAQTPAASHAAQPAPTNSSGELQSAPLNPEFVEYMDNVRAGRLPATETVRGHSLGYVPPPLELSHLKNQPAQSAVTSSFPASYDLRTYNRISPVRDQSTCGDCWAFATFASAESILMPGESHDYSENNLKDLAGFDWTPCAGGNAHMSAAYLARWAGPVNESDDPYHPTDTNTSPANAPIQRHEQQIIFIPGRTSPTDNDQIKAAVRDRGGLAIAMYMDESSSYLNTTTSAYYFNDTSATSTNHMVTIAGWDDNYSATNFTQAPAGNGAFLVKNSWGSGWGQSGYFWASYYSLLFANSTSASFGGEQPLTTYSHRYEYDPLGWISSIGYSGVNTLRFANIFTATEPGYLDAVSTYVASNNSTYTLTVYKGVTAGSPTSGTAVFSDSGTVPYAGYWTFTVNPAHLATGDTFSVVMMLTTPGAYPGPYQTKVSGYSSKATAAAGRGYYSPDGATWYDLTTSFDSYGSFALKAFTSADTTPPTTTPTFNPPAGTYTSMQNVSIVAPSGATIYYTTDGSTPSIFSRVYTGAISVGSNTTVRAIAVTSGHSTSAIGSAVYTVSLAAAAAPTISPATGTYGTVELITLTPVTSGTSIYYTTDGSTPSTSSAAYVAPIVVASTKTIKAIAASATYTASPVTSATYTIIPSTMVLSGLATSIGSSRATLTASLNDFSGTGQYWFQWGTSPSSMTNNTPKTDLTVSAHSQNVSAPITGLTSKTTYYFRPLVSTVGGLTYGAVQTFCTK